MSFFENEKQNETKKMDQFLTSKKKGNNGTSFNFTAYIHVYIYIYFGLKNIVPLV